MCHEDLRTRSGLPSDLKSPEDNSRYQAGWRELNDTYGPLLLSFAKKRGLSESDAQDVRQEILVALTGAISSYDKRKGRFRAFLLGIAYRKYVDHCRATLRMKFEPLEGNEFQVPAEVEKAWDSEWTRAVQDAAFQKLRYGHPRVQERTWQMARELFVRGREPAEIAARYDTKTRDVYKVTESWKAPFESALREVAAAWDWGTTTPASAT